MIRLIIEDEKTAAIRAQIADLDLKQLVYLEEAIKKERKKRQDSVFTEWQGVLNTYLSEYNAGK